MIKSVNNQMDAKLFASIYNNANTMFPENARCDADEEIFYRQLAEDNNFIYANEYNVCGFVSYHMYADVCGVL